MQLSPPAGWWGSLGDGERRDVAGLVVMGFDVASSLLFLFAVWFLAVREGEGDKGRLSAADYTVMIPPGSLPPHESIVALDGLLRRHFEEVLPLRPAVSSREKRQHKPWLTAVCFRRGCVSWICVKVASKGRWQKVFL